MTIALLLLLVLAGVITLVFPVLARESRWRRLRLAGEVQLHAIRVRLAVDQMKMQIHSDAIRRRRELHHDLKPMTSEPAKKGPANLRSVSPVSFGVLAHAERQRRPMNELTDEHLPAKATGTQSPVAFAVYERDLWVVRATKELRIYFTGVGLTLPKHVTIKTGTTQLVDGVSARGECWPSKRSPEGVPGILISASLTNAFDVLATLVHELIHAADNCQSHHGPWFAAWAEALGLIGNMPSTTAGPSLRRYLEELAYRLGPFPAAHFGYLIYANGKAVA